MLFGKHLRRSICRQPRPHLHFIPPPPPLFPPLWGFPPQPLPHPPFPLASPPPPHGHGEFRRSFAACGWDGVPSASSFPNAPAVSKARPSGFCSGPPGPSPAPPAMISSLPCSSRSESPLHRAGPELRKKIHFGCQSLQRVPHIVFRVLSRLDVCRDSNNRRPLACVSDLDHVTVKRIVAVRNCGRAFLSAESEPMHFHEVNERMCAADCMRVSQPCRLCIVSE